MPFHSTVAPDANPEPFTVSVNAGPPATAEAGERLVNTGLAVIAKGSAAGTDSFAVVVTSMVAVPADAIRFAGTAAVSWVEETKVVASELPFQVMAVVLVNPVPFAVSVNAAPPAVTFAGEMLVSVSGARMVKGREAGCGEPVTLTAAVPVVVSRLAGTCAVS